MMRERMWLSVVIAAMAVLGGEAQAVQDDGGGEPLPKGVLKLSVEYPSAETVGDDGTVASVEPMRVSMAFEDATLKDVLKTFSQQTGINVIVGSELGDQPVTLYLEDVSVMDALDQILGSSNLTYERPVGSEIYIVKPKAPEDAQAGFITRVYRLKYAQVSRSILAQVASALRGKTPFEGSVGAGSSKGGGGGGGAGGGGGGGGGGTTGETSVGIDEIVQQLLSPRGRVVVDGRTNSLIVTDVPENFPRLEAALAALDVRTAQIIIDAEIIETTLTKTKDLGFEWGSDAEGTLFQLTPARKSTRFPFSHLFGDQNRKAATKSSITLGTVDSSKAVAVLQALESDSETKILARPKVLTLDNESALIRLTTDEAIGFSTSSQATTGTQSSEAERTTTGIVLVVTPQVNEGGYITMVVEPSVTKTVTSRISPPAGQATPRDPKTRSSRTMVRIRSGDTLVVGGLIDRSEQNTFSQVPVLSGVPFVGELFKNKEDSDSASELLVFITPRLLEEATAAQIASKGQLPMGLREQEAVGARQERIEETLNALEREPNL